MAGGGASMTKDRGKGPVEIAKPFNRIRIIAAAVAVVAAIVILGWRAASG